MVKKFCLIQESNGFEGVLYIPQRSRIVALSSVAQSARAVEYTDCTSAVGWAPPRKWVSWIRR